MDSDICRAVGALYPADGHPLPELSCRSRSKPAVERDFLLLARLSEQRAVRRADVDAVRANLFANSTVHVAAEHLAQMARTVAAVERIVARPEYRQRVLNHAPPVARHPPRAAGVFLGYDFHLAANGPRLIEINTNAGGGLLNAHLLGEPRDGQRAAAQMPSAATRIEADFVAMFREEWRLAQGAASPRRLRRIAIVDAQPPGQFLAPEFELFRQLFERHGIAALIADPSELSFDGQHLSWRGQPIDLVYNRLTDFVLHEPQHAALRAAYLADAVVLTPHPQNHALYADKRNLATLGDRSWLERIGVDGDDVRLLSATIPQTAEVLPATAEAFWSSRKQWFFKPTAGFGSRAAYRGDKLTRRVFAEIARGGYVAQEVVAPPERRVLVDGQEEHFKVDLRNYAYLGSVQLVAARLYRGQTTNFRTPGGGFAAVFPLSSRSGKGSDT